MNVSADIGGLESFKASLEGIGAALLDEAALMEIAGEARDMVLARTTVGRDIYGKEFTPYSRRYRQTKEKKGFDGDVVDLRLTGQMLSDLSLGADKGETVIFFCSVDSEEKAARHNSGYDNNMPQRAFFGLSEEDKDYLESRFSEYAYSVIREANNR